MSGQTEDQIIISELVEAISQNNKSNKVTKYIKTEARRIPGISDKEVSRETLIKDLYNKVDELLLKDKKILASLRLVYQKHGIDIKDNKDEKLISNNYCNDAKKAVIDDILCRF